jgi:hypothetical protein
MRTDDDMCLGIGIALHCVDLLETCSHSAAATFLLQSSLASLLSAQHQHEVEDTPESGNRVTFAVTVTAL